MRIESVLKMFDEMPQRKRRVWALNERTSVWKIGGAAGERAASDLLFFGEFL